MKQKEEQYPYLVLFLCSFLLFTYSLSKYSFTFLHIPFSCDFFFIPVLFFLMDHLIIYSNKKKAMIGVFLSSLSLICYAFLLSFSLVDSFSFSVIGRVCAYLGSSIFFFLLNPNPSRMISFFQYFLSVIFYDFILILFSLNQEIEKHFLIQYFIMISIQAILCITLLRKKKKG